MSHDEMYQAALQNGEFTNESDELGEGEFEGEFGPYGQGESESEHDEFGEMYAQEAGESDETDETDEMDEFEQEFIGEGESDEAGQYAQAYESDELQESDEIALASELLEVTNEEELDQFLGKLIKKVGGVARGVLATPAGGALKGLLRSAAKRALPLAGRAIGGYFGGSTGANIGGRLGSAAGRMFGLELEGLSDEDQEFEVARRFVKLATQTTRRLPPRATPGQARSTFLKVARQMAPGLARNFGRGLGQGLSGYGQRRRPYRRRPSASGSSFPMTPQSQARSVNTASRPGSSYPMSGGGISIGATTPGGERGRWVRSGNRIILYGV